MVDQVATAPCTDRIQASAIMQRMKIVIFCVWLMLVTAGTSSARGWRGLIPLHSTRQDVERLLGSPSNTYYDLKNETVYVDFSSGNCQGAEPDSYKVPLDTIIRIMVIPKWEPSLKALRVDITGYKKSADQNVANHVFYHDRETGESIEVFDGKVQSITYTPAASEASLRCHSSVEDWIATSNIVCVIPISKFDDFGEISIDEEHQRLRNLALHLKSQPPVSRSTILVYGVKKDEKPALARRAKRIKHFLVKQLGVAPGRVLTMAAGPLEERRVEIWISSVGQDLPGPKTMN